MMNTLSDSLFKALLEEGMQQYAPIWQALAGKEGRATMLHTTSKLIASKEARQMREEAGNATPGPWAAWNAFHLVREEGQIGVSRVGPDGGGGLETANGGVIVGSRQDFRFIVSARIDIPRLAETILALWPIVEAIATWLCMLADDQEPEHECGECITCQARKLVKEAQNG